jgi:hypothetical protein
LVLTTNTLKLLTLSHADDNTLYSTSEETLYPVENLQISQPSLQWRSTSLADQQIWNRFSAESVCSGFTLYEHNLSASATVRIALSSTVKEATVTGASHTTGVVTITFSAAHGLDVIKEHAFWVTGVVGMTDLNSRVFDVASIPSSTTITISLTTAQGYTSGGAAELNLMVYDETEDAYLPRYGIGEGELGVIGLGGFAISGINPTMSSRWFDSVTATDLLSVVSDANSDDAYIAAGRLMVQSHWEAEYNFDWGVKFGHQDMTGITRSRGGTLHSTNKPSFRNLLCNFSFLDEAESIELHDILGMVGRRGDVLVSAFPDMTSPLQGATDIYGRITKYSLITRQRYGYGINFYIEENI